jgi:rhamnosyltransferase
MIKIAGVVTLYNPDLTVLKNIESYIDQIDLLFAFDNSEVENSLLKDELIKNLKIVYTHNKKNLGVAKVLNLAAQNAIKMGYDYLLTMDQDSKAMQGMINEMFDKSRNIENVGIISPLHIGKFNTKKVPLEDIKEELVVMTSGNLLNLKVYKQAGLFRDDFFIDYVDTEYCMRLNLNNYKVIKINSAFLYHNEANVSESKFLFKKVFPYNHSPIRMYYKVRNRFYLRDMYIKYFPEYFKWEFPLFRNMIFKIILFEKNRIKKLYYAFSGYIDYKKGIMDRIAL